jgi:hypothetical protein
MSVIFAGGEIESFDLTGSNQLVNTTAADKYDSDYARMSVAHSGAPTTAYISTSFTGITEGWLHFSAGFEVIMDGTNARIALEYWNGASFTRMNDFGIDANTLITFDIHFKIADAGGRFAIYMNGNLLDEFIGDTNLFASAQVDGIELAGGNSTSNTAHEVNYSEVIVADEPTIGWRVATIVPNADGNTVGEWTGGFADVDEITANDSDNLNSTTSNDTETMGATNLSTPAGALNGYKAVVAQARVKDDGGSSPLQFQFIVRTGGTDYFSSTIALGSSYSSEENLWLVNPGTTNPWTQSEIDAIELGVESIA